jgi:NAD(P)-dependent dehydrogenase (short-subunit alcohol dehydrogenase family)
VRAFAQLVARKHPVVDVLVNNAGTSLFQYQHLHFNHEAQAFGTELKTTAQGIEVAFAANHVGHFLLTGLLLDQLKRSKSARIINVSSLGHKVAEKWDWKKIENPTGRIGLHHLK